MKSISFDSVLTAYDAAANTLIDYHMTPAISEVNRTMESSLQAIRDKYEGDRALYEKDEQYKKLMGLKETIEQTQNRVLRAQKGSNSIGGKALGFAFSANVAQRLANFKRPIAEFMSNLFMAGFKTPRTSSRGVNVIRKNKLLKGGKMANILSNLGSTQVQRLTGPSDIALATGGATSGPGSLGVKSTAGEIIDAATGLPTMAADMVMSTPDMAVGLPVWTGSFDSKFESITGKKPDYEKIISNDERYMRQNADALKRATQFADRRSIAQSATKTAFSGIEAFKGDFKKGESDIIRKANSFMRNFARYEYETSIQGIQALLKEGEMSKTEAIGAIAGSATRYFAYTAVMGELARQLPGFLGGDDEEESIKKGRLSGNGEFYIFDEYGDIPEDIRELADVRPGTAGYYVDRDEAEAWEDNQDDALIEYGMKGLGQYLFQFITGGGGGLSAQALNMGINMLLGEEYISRKLGVLDENEVYRGYKDSVLYSKLSKLTDDISEGKEVNVVQEAIDLLLPIGDPLLSRSEDVIMLVAKKQRIENKLADPEQTKNMSEEEISELQSEVVQLGKDINKQSLLSVANLLFSGPIMNTIVQSELDKIKDRFFESEVKPPKQEEVVEDFEAPQPTLSKDVIKDSYFVSGPDAINDIMTYNSGRNSKYSLMEEIIMFEMYPDEWNKEFNKEGKSVSYSDVYGRYTNNTPLTRQAIIDYIRENAPRESERNYFENRVK